MIRGVIFDLDDTLYDYTECNKKAVEEVFRWVEYNLGISRDRADNAYREAKKLVKSRLGHTAASHNRMLYMQTMLELCGMKPAAHSLALYNRYWDAVLENIRLFPYVRSLWNDLRRYEIKIAVLSDLTAQIQHRKLLRLGIASDVDVLVTSEEAGEEKPSAKMFDLVVRKLGYSVKELVMVGDSFEKDVRGAMNCGIEAVWFAQNKQHPNQKTGAEITDYLLKRVLDENGNI